MYISFLYITRNHVLGNGIKVINSIVVSTSSFNN